MPGPPGTTQPFGAVGNCEDCSPGTLVSSLPCASYQGMLTSQRIPRFIVSVGTPTEKLLKPICGTYSGNPGGPDGLIPRVPTPVTNSRSESFAKLPFGLSVIVAVRKKLTRASFTALGPRVLVLLMTICCA